MPDHAAVDVPKRYIRFGEAGVTSDRSQFNEMPGTSHEVICTQN
jgi:hypothetical protein